MAQEVDINRFDKGMNTDFSAVNQPDNTYFFGKNAIRKDSGEILSEYGTTIYTAIPTGMRILGAYVLRDDIVLFLCNATNTQSEIGVINAAGVYTPYINNRGVAVNLMLPGNFLNFNITKQIDVEGRILFNDDRVVYFTDNFNQPRVVNLDRVTTLPTTSPAFEDAIFLFYNFSVPVVTLNTVLETGNVPTGVYQFAARYLTNDNNKTGFGIISNAIPIVEESRSLGRKDFDGNLPQTPAAKSIVLDITNLDTNYPAVEIAMITYNGLASTPSFNIVGTVQVPASGVATFTLSSLTQITEEITLDELTALGISYNTAKSITQKDGHLILANLTQTNRDLNFQLIANKILVKYEIDEVTINEPINIDSGSLTDVGASFDYPDYKDEKQVESAKTWRRGEVYSLSIVPIFRDGSYGFAYHIPGDDVTTTVNTTAATVTPGLLGTYVSTETYPSGFNFPGTGAGYQTNIPAKGGAVVNNNVRHHIMPRMTDNSAGGAANRIITGTIDSPSLTIRRLKLRFENIDLSSVSNDVKGYLIVRQERNNPANRTIITQGIAKNMYNTGTPKFYTPVPYLGKTTIEDFPNNANTFDWEEISNRSTAMVPYNGLNVAAFYSPDLIHNNSLPIIPSYQIRHDITYLVRPVRKNGVPATGFDNGSGDSAGGGGNTGHAWTVSQVFNSFQLLPTASAAAMTAINDRYYTPGARNITKVNFVGPQYLAAGSREDDFNLANGNVRIDECNGFWNFELDGDLAKNYIVRGLTGAGEAILDSYADYNNGAPSAITTWSPNVGIADEVEIYNIINPNTSCYGPILNAEYVYVTHSFNTASTTLTNVFGGDTFISKYGFTIKERLSDSNQAAGFHTIFYCPIESEANYNYRHFIQPQTFDNASFQVGTLPYYPKYKKIWSTTAPLGLLNFDSGLGYSTGYNKQYSKDNNIRKYYPKPLNFQVVTSFKDRIIYSERSFEGELADQYRIFLPNNFYDLPKNKGEIIEVFVFNNTLFAHTPQTLFQTFFNPLTTQSSSQGTITLGDAGIFKISAKELFTVAGGYAGTESQFSGCNTPFGRFFIDTIQKKVFLLTEQLNEVSNQGMFYYFLNNLPSLTDNPSNGIGYMSGYDYMNKRWIMTKLVNGDNEFTLSYSPQLQSWSFFHSYIPNYIITKGNSFYMYKNGLNSLWRLNDGVQGSYFGSAQQNVEITFIINKFPDQSKDFDDLVINSTCFDEIANTFKHLTTFNKIQVFNDNQNSSLVDILTSNAFNVVPTTSQVLSRWKNNQYQLPIPRNAVVNDTLNIFNPGNIDLTKLFKDSIRGKYAKIVLQYVPTPGNNYRLTLNFIQNKFRTYIR